jgi:hypothetical protein
MVYMDMHPNKYWGVITGDFIGFSSLNRSVRSRMPQLVVDAGKSLCSAIGPVMPWDVDVFRGDGWQALVSAPVSAMRAALFFRAYIISAAGEDHVDMRMGIGIGPVDYVPDGRVSAGDGPAYRASGKLLEKMGSPRQGKIRCAFAKGEKIRKDMSACALDEDLMDALVRLAGTMGDTWRSRRARAITGALGGWSQARIAENWPGKISRQAVGKHLQGAGWHALSHALGVFETKMACLTSCSSVNY